MLTKFAHKVIQKIQKMNEEYQHKFDHNNFNQHKFGQYKFGQRELVLNKLSLIRHLASKIYKGTLIIQKQDYYKENNEREKKEKEKVYMHGELRTEYKNIYKIKYNLSLCENAYVAFAKRYKDSDTEMHLDKVLLLLENI